MTSKQIANLILICVSCALATFEIVLLWHDIPVWISILLLVLMVAFVVAFVISWKKQWESVYKTSILCIIVGIILLSAVAIIIKCGVLERFDSVEELQAYISNNPLGIFIYITISFLQVTFVPIPSTIVTVAGYVIFGKMCILYSLIGQFLGSLLAFFLGKKFGVKLVIWIVGKEMYEKYMKLIRGKDKAVLSFMFLFPFFPDDILCMLAGLTTFSYLGFSIVIIIARTTTILYTTFLTKYISKIPLSGWGLGIWAAIIVIILALLYLCWKYGDKLENKLTAFIYKITKKLPPEKMSEAELSLESDIKQAEQNKDMDFKDYLNDK